MDPPVIGQARMQRSPERQSHIFFLQPDWDTIVKPLQRYMSGANCDLPPVRYGDWHQEKVALAFGLPRRSEGYTSHDHMAAFSSAASWWLNSMAWGCATGWSAGLS